MLKHSQIKSIEKEVNKRLHETWSKEMYFSISEAHFNYDKDLKDFVTIICQAGRYNKAEDKISDVINFQMEIMELETKNKNEVAVIIYAFLIKEIDEVDICKRIK